MNESPAGAPALSVRGVGKRFGDFVALRDINLDIAAGEFVCFLGPSGCGKTTLLRLIAGLDSPSAGAILHQGRDITREPPERRGFGIVFQSYALFPNLSVAENIAYGLDRKRLPRAERRARVTELLQQVGLPGIDDKYPSQCSGGQQQRIALARALAPRPGLLLLDEPLSALDAKVRVQLRAQVKGLQHRLGVTTILVTHDQEEALTMADRVVVMNHGVIEQVGTPEDVYCAPATPFVAGFVGTMNFVPASVASSNRLRIGESEIAGPADGFSAGAAVLAAIRPEHLLVDAAGTVNGMPAEVTNVEFLGAQTRVFLRLATGSEAQAVLAPGRAEKLALREGGAVSVQMPAEHLRIYPGSDSGIQEQG